MRRCHGSAAEVPFFRLCTLCALACGYKSLVLRLVQQGLGHRGFPRSQLGSHFANFMVFDMVTFFVNVLMMNFVLFMVLAGIVMAMQMMVAML